MKKLHGFTLIELSIVLVIIGLIVGGVLVGQDLIRAAYIRAQITQIEKFNTAVNTFFGKYQALPGDMNATTAAAFGFTPRAGATVSMMDGNGILVSNEGGTGVTPCGLQEAAGETTMFWVDLTTANGLNLNLIEGGFSAAAPFTAPTQDLNGTQLARFFPTAKIGGGNYVYVWSGGVNVDCMTFGSDGRNYYGISAISHIALGDEGETVSNVGMTVKQAYDIDRKIDDGYPQNGNVQAVYVSGAGGDSSYSYYAAGGGAIGNNPGMVTAPSPTTCYDNNSSTSVMHYSTAVNGGSGLNCALSFKMQGGD